MPPQLNIKKQLAESGEGIYINRWWTGLISNRSPLFVPVSALGLQIIARHDSMIDGLNMEISPRMTPVRRPGYPRYCSVQLGAEKPLTFFSFKNTSGIIKTLVDTNVQVASFTTSALTSLYTKGTTVQTSFTKVGSMLYLCDGTNLKKWDGTTVSGWGISAPITAATVTPGAGSLSPTRGYQWVYVFKNSSTGHISTAGPVSANTGAVTSKNFALQGDRSTDPQVDKVQIYRIKDGGSVYYFVAEIANPVAGSWSYTDNNADSALNSFLIAPTAHLNDPPPAGASLSCFHMGRMWLAVGNKLYFGGGPQVTNGVPEEAFPPANVFVLPGKITAMLSTSTGLAVWTPDDMFYCLGTDIGNFYVQRFQCNFGVASQNCVIQDGDLLFVFTSNKQLFALSDSLSEIGFSIRDKLAAFSPAFVYLALHRAGTDEGLFVSNGIDTVYRYSIAQTCWCPKATVVGGVGALAECEVNLADYRLMAGRNSNAGYLLARDTGSTYADDGATYAGSINVGTIILSPPGSVSSIRSIMVEALPIGTFPTVGILLNEVSGGFTTLPNPVPEPPMLPATTTVLAKRHYLAGAATPLPQQCRFITIQLSLAQEAAANEILGLAIGT